MKNKISQLTNIYPENQILMHWNPDQKMMKIIESDEDLFNHIYLINEDNPLLVFDLSNNKDLKIESNKCKTS